MKNVSFRGSSPGWSDCDRPVIANTGMIVSEVGSRVADRYLRVELFSQSASRIMLSLVLLDRARRELHFEGQDVTRQLKRAFKLRRMYLHPSNRETRRVLRGLGSGSVYYGSRCICVAEAWLRDVRYIGFRVQPCSRSSAGLEPVYAERRLSDFGLGKKERSRSHAFLLTPTQIEDRINLIARTYRMASGESDSHALTKLMFSMVGGYDTPLVWNFEETNNEES